MSELELALCKRLATAALGWASRGRDEFIVQLQIPEFQRLYQERISGDPVLLVYGPTQVGKTELILRLLGFDLGAAKYSEVKAALRGGRELGNSASSTATVYRRYDGRDFSLRAAGVERSGLSAIELQAAIADIRKRVETNRWAPDQPPVEVAIPEHLADAPVLTGGLTILDLPGYGSATAAEKPHVERLLRRYLPVASVVILVYSAMQFSDLASPGPAELQDWECDVARFRLVLTHAIAPIDVQQGLFGPQAWTMEDLRTYYRAELRKGVPTCPDALAVHPVEYGKTWADFKVAHPREHARMTPLVDAELRSLAAGLPAPTQEQQLMSLIRAHTFVEARAAKRRTEHNAAVAAARAKRSDAVSAYQRARVRGERLHETVNRIAGERLNLVAPQIGVAALPAESDQDADHFVEYLHDVESSINVTARQAVRELEGAVGAAGNARAVMKRVEHTVHESLRDIRERLHGYFFLTYQIFWESQRDVDRDACRAAARAAASGAEAVLTAAQREADAVWRAGQAQRHEKALKFYALQAREVKECKRAVEEATAAELEAQERLNAWERASASDLELAVDFRRFLLRALDAACADWRREVRSSGPAVARLSACFAILVATQRADALDLLPEEHP